MENQGMFTIIFAKFVTIVVPLPFFNTERVRPTLKSNKLKQIDTSSHEIRLLDSCEKASYIHARGY